MKFEKKEKISIIIPVYKVEKYLNKCVESVVNQTYKNLEIILVDDGSPDSCPIICDEWAKKDNRIKVIHQKNQGVSVARNTGLKIASGEYIGFVDSDDYISQKMYETLYNVIKETRSDIVQCRFQHVYSSGKTVPCLKIKEGVISNKELLFELLLKRVISFISVNKLFTKEVLYDVSFPINIKSCEDMFFVYCSLKNTNKIVLINDVFYSYFIGRTESATKLGLALKDTIIIFDLVKDDLNKYYPNLIKYLDMLAIHRITYFYKLSRKALTEGNHNIVVCKHMMLWSRLTFKHRLKYLFFKSECSKRELLKCFLSVFFPRLFSLIRMIYRVLFRKEKK